MSSEEELMLLAVACICIKKKNQHQLKKRRRPRRRWVKDWLLKRNQYSHISLLEELRFEPDDWRNYLRMDEDSYVILLNLVTPLIEKQDTQMRSAISTHERLSATLRYLATGRNYEDLKFSTLISPQSLCNIIPETCSAIYKVLKDDYMKVSKYLQYRVLINFVAKLKGVNAQSIQRLKFYINMCSEMLRLGDTGF